MTVKKGRLCYMVGSLKGYEMPRLNRETVKKKSIYHFENKTNHNARKLLTMQSFLCLASLPKSNFEQLSLTKQYFDNSHVTKHI